MFYLISFSVYMCLCPQGFLSDLLQKANRHYDDQKLQEYTQTIVSLSHKQGHNKQAQVHNVIEQRQILWSL